MYNRETIEVAGYSKMRRVNRDTVYLWNPVDNKTELWHRSPHYAGYAVVIGKTTYEFVGNVPNIRFCDECQDWEVK
jgi:hypothetical protein